jgi:hypothetical protein
MRDSNSAGSGRRRSMVRAPEFEAGGLYCAAAGLSALPSGQGGRPFVTLASAMVRGARERHLAS